MNVLFIEDDRMNRRVVKDMLDVAGSKLIEAETGEEGLALLDGADYDILLVDLRMPGMDGMEVIGHVRARADHKGRIPIIVVTADAAPHLRAECLAAGADEVLFKPVAMTALFNSMGAVLAKRASEGGLIG